ncbi:helix-turn-helix domain-containing protein [Phenylobacterium deserti]|uniref:Helix-turn-helix domain-containing protein n=1 Tax=Phenylobacterium deserti TaxID=1914756 RepID=A0A328APY9_9CAUL|nr:helix-turn-helix domain-containing protein [Phenylobacterium deserti]RAK56639.1 helix-turn-helix domain-containing protein [Phenylobacterium deserti]
MPLDTGVPELNLDAGSSELSTPAPNLYSGADIGQALRAIREHHGLSLDELAEATRVRASYLEALEEMRLELLPSRPFTIGYIRAYAHALGVDPDAAVERFKADEPVLDEPLRAPIGVIDERDPRLRGLMGFMALIIVAIVLYNIAQRAMMEAAPPPPTAPEQTVARALQTVKSGPVSLGAPLPAPVESTTPPAYETPGLAEAHLAEDGKTIVLEGQPKPVVGPPEMPADLVLVPTFKPAGAILGAAPNQPSAVTLQALKPAALIVRGADGSVYFARQLNKGEAYRVPMVGGLVADVSEPEAFQVFVAGASRGVLPAPQVALAKLAG